MKYVLIALMSVVLVGCVSDSEQEVDPNHCSTGNEYTYNAPKARYTYEVNNCNDIIELDKIRDTTYTDYMKFEGGITVWYHHQFNDLNGKQSLNRGDVYAYEWVEHGAVHYFKWDQNSRCYLTDTGEYLCEGDSFLESVKVMYEYSDVMYEFKEAKRNATRVYN